MFLGKEVRIFLKPQAQDSLAELKSRTDKEAVMLVRSIERAISLLKENLQFGNPVAKNLIPEQMKQDGIKNLYRIELSNFWRLLYTVEGNQLYVFAFVLNIVDHPTYNKIFGYRKR